MGIFDFLIISDKRPKRVFISFAVEDELYRDYLVGQAKNKRSPFEFIDMSVKEPYPNAEWKKRCRTRIKGCDGLIVLLSKHTYQSRGARWEIKCAIEEGISVTGMHIRKGELYIVPPELKRKKIMTWTWNNVKSFIATL